MNDSTKNINPYTKEEVEQALVRLMQSERFTQGVQYFHPDWTKEHIQSQLKKCRSCADFEILFIEPIIKKSIETSMTNFEVKGLEDFKPTDSFLCIANHRDIFLDAGLLQYALYHRGLPFTEISLGDNLMVDDLIETVAKMNNMFTVYRTGNRMELVRNAQKLSAYLRHTVSTKKVSAWIAQGNGRTKDGNDRTFPGLVNMLLMSGGEDYKKSLEELQIVIASISYEYEPCAFDKALEMEIRFREGGYKKSKYEDMNSIVKGLQQPKGQVSLTLEKLNLQAIDFSGRKKEVVKNIVQAIDQTVYKSYQLWKTHYMAFDKLHQSSRYQAHYTQKDMDDFNAYLDQNTSNKAIIHRVITMYAQAVER